MLLELCSAPHRHPLPVTLLTRKVPSTHIRKGPPDDGAGNSTVDSLSTLFTKVPIPHVGTEQEVQSLHGASAHSKVGLEGLTSTNFGVAAPSLGTRVESSPQVATSGVLSSSFPDYVD